MAFSSASAKPLVSGALTASEGSVRRRPGLEAATDSQPSSSATVPPISKYKTDFQPSRPRSRIEPAPATARIKTPTSTGAMIERIRRRKIVLRNSIRPVCSGAAKPKAAPPAAASSIQLVSERRGTKPGTSVYSIPIRF